MRKQKNRVALASAACLATLGVAGLANTAPPDVPSVVEDMAEVGKPGGELTMLVSRSKDTRLFYVYGYARLVGYDKKLNFFPDILESYEVKEGRSFTFHLRPGHKWSDGAPFTTEDFRFFWEDIAQNEALRPTGPPVEMTVEGELPVVEIIDDTTIRYTWSNPNPFFLPRIAAASPLFIYAPSHYLKGFHAAYVDDAEMERLVADDEARDWAQLFGRRHRVNKFDNPDLPTLQPWMITNAPPAERFVGARNPYYHRVDVNGQQLPYIDKLTLQVVDSKLIPAKTGAGETDLQSRGLFFKDYTFLKESEDRSDLVANLWREARSAHLALYPNLNAADDSWRALFRDRRFREALSLAVDREAVSQYLYFGLAVPSNNTLLPGSPLYTDEIGNACLGFDLDRANQLLDEVGLSERDSRGIRLLPDGRPLEIVVETAGEDTEQTDVLEIIRDSWAQIGLRIHSKPSEREVLRNRIFAGEALMTIWYGLQNGLPTASMSPSEFVPTSQFDQLQWSKWGQFYETKGEVGEAPDEAAAKSLIKHFSDWKLATDQDQRRSAWEEILKVYAAECYTIGIVADVMQPVVVRSSLRNVPEEGVYNWEPHGQLGIYRPDTFWFAE